MSSDAPFGIFGNYTHKSLESYVTGNKKILDWLKDKNHNNEFLGKYYGTLDYATARFNTILLKLSQDKIKEQETKDDVALCFKIIQDFYRYTVKYSKATVFTRWYYANCLHGLGINQIPKVKKLLQKLDN
tara:strand:+ start:180 stop:569 length:390 start_codon:yes stop_codon:yes gene_type:complete